MTETKEPKETGTPEQRKLIKTMKTRGLASEAKIRAFVMGKMPQNVGITIQASMVALATTAIVYDEIESVSVVDPRFSEPGGSTFYYTIIGAIASHLTSDDKVSVAVSCDGHRIVAGKTVIHVNSTPVKSHVLIIGAREFGDKDVAKYESEYTQVICYLIPPKDECIVM